MTAEATPELHANLEQVAFLLGSWAGEGAGEYPTIAGFPYVEQVTFSHDGRPFLAYQQRTVRTDTNGQSHAELGYLRAIGAGRVELVTVAPNGIGVAEEGTVEGTTIDTASTAVMRTSTAKEVTAIGRTFVVEDDVLRYTLRLAAVGQPLQHHLEAVLRRV